MMTFRGRTLAAAVLGLLLSSAALADTLELKDGRVIQGRYLGGTAAVMRFEVNGEVQTFNVSQIVALTFTGSSATSAPATPAPPPAPAAAEPEPVPSAPSVPVVSRDAISNRSISSQDPAAQYGEVTLPAGQSLLVRMIDSVDSSRNQVGDMFHASLETDLYVHETLVARKGTDVYGQLANAKEAGHMAGSSELQLELTRIVIDGRDYPLVSSDYTLQGKGRGADTAKKVGGGAVVGAIIGAIAGGGKGAAVGAAAGSAAGAGVQVFTRGQQVKVPSETLLEFRLQQPAMVTPARS
ncbi:MAG TPA: hypothetical protein VE077_16620 [Candidatus Methylomirabilis sp.]|nr:hypothetical protein [Candidatus Methylomirabilis sp.]